MNTRKTKIEFEWDGEKYVLEYTADSLRTMVKRGFDITKVEAELLILAETLFVGSFIANHDDVEEPVRREIFKELCAMTEGDESESIESVVVQMFTEAVNELGSHRGNVKWKVTR